MRDLLSLLHFHNPWWLSKTVPEQLNPPFRRPVFTQIMKYIEIDRILILKGPRRTGKSTLMYQMIAELLSRGIASQRILYLPFDDPDLDFNFSEIILAYEKQLERELSQGPEVYFFLDEIQHLDNWSGFLKKYWDKKLPIKFIVSGSSASLIRRDSESLTGRTVEMTMLPFNFFEYCLFQMTAEEAVVLSECHEQFSLFQPNLPVQVSGLEKKIAILFEKYLQIGGFPEMFMIAEPMLRKKLLQEDIIEKVIYRDLVKQYGIKKPEVLEKLFLYLVSHSSDILNVSSIGNSLKLSREVVQDYLQYLRAAYLIMMVPKYAAAIETVIRANQKVHVLDAGFMQVFGATAIARRIESVVGRHLYFHQPYYFRNRFEVDFVLRLDSAVVPIEVKFRENIRKEDLAGVRAFVNEFPASKSAIVVTRNLYAVQEQMYLIPAHLFLALV